MGVYLHKKKTIWDHQEVLLKLAEAKSPQDRIFDSTHLNINKDILQNEPGGGRSTN
jgi:hypothetical protein